MIVFLFFTTILAALMLPILVYQISNEDRRIMEDEKNKETPEGNEQQ